jgi:ribokinase
LSNEASSAGPIVVIGSVNMDLVCRTPAIPKPGETVLGNDFLTIPGGKGANQAVAAAKLARPGTDVHLIARVGEDDFGERLLNGLVQHGVKTEFVTITEGVASGVAMILVDRKGENSIVVTPGANARLTPRDIDAAEALIRRASAVVLQLEIPLETVRHAVAMCRSHGVHVILDPAPVPPRAFPRALYGVDVLTPNQGEAEHLLGLDRPKRVTRKRVEDPKQIAAELLSRGPGAVVLKLGPKGSLGASDGGLFELARPYKVKVVDMTAAGDAFTAGLAVARAESLVLRDSLRFANAAGALACTSFGAQPALPARDAVDQLIKRSTRG